MSTITTSRSVVSYLRVSTDRQGKSGLGLDAKRAAIAVFARANGLTIVGEHVEVETGKGSDALDRRPQLAAALAAARQSKCAVVVAKLDRLSRDVAFLAGLMAQRVPFIVTELGADADPFMLHIYAPRGERAVHDRGTHPSGVAGKKAAGAVLGNRINLAEASRIGAAVQARDADTFAANVLPIIREIQASGIITLRGIADVLAARSIKTARGGTWTATQVARIIERA